MRLNYKYTYDANGNLTSDVNKEILSITYNELNLLVTIIFTQNRRLEYLYDALGNKRRQIASDGTIVKTTDFMDNFVYVNDVPAWHSFDEGRIIYNSTES